MILKPKVAAGQPEQAKSTSWMFRPIERPAIADSLKFPEDITRLSSRDVGASLGYYTAMHAYAVSELAKAEIAHLRARSVCESRRKNIARTGMTYGKSKYIVDREIRLDRTLELMEKESHEAEIKTIEIRSYVEIFDKYAQALSREMTRRSSESKLVRT